MAAGETVTHPWMANSVAAIKAADAGRDRRRLDRGAVRADPGRASPAPPARPAAGPARRGRSAPAPDRDAEAQRDLRGQSQLPGCRLLAASRAGRGRRDRRPLRVPDQCLGLAAIRFRPQPGLVRVCEPARRAGRHGGRLAAGLLLGLCRRPRDPHGGADHRPPRGAGAAASATPSACRSSAATASRPRWPATSTWSLVAADPATGRLDLADLARQALGRAPPPSTSRARPISA